MRKLSLYHRPMIDCHVHAFPGLGSSAGDVLDRVAGVLGDQSHLSAPIGLLARGLRGLADLGAPAVALDTGRFFTPDWWARLRQSAPGQLHSMVDTIGALVATPQVLAWGTIPGLLASMDRHGIEQSVLIAGGPLMPNDWVLGEAASRGSGRFVPVAALPDGPSDAGEDTWTERLLQLADAGARGLKIHVNMDGLPPDHVAYRALFAVAEARNLFVIIHTGCFEVPGYRRPGAVAPGMFHELFERFPEVRVCLAHMNRDDPEAAWDTMTRFEQVYADTSWQPVKVIANAVSRVGAARLLLGSDWPLLHAGMQGGAVDALRLAVGEEVARRIGDDNARHFLGTPSAS
jgi:predicted TIM-barrel fold metal-dependent hydrolase